ncbi:hypothetical protein K490DRAFT_39894, partial [Saccharata proteae CBS 121410]
QLPSLEYLEFHSCYDGFQCARLELPLDYWNGTNPGKTISLAVTVLPAKVPVTDPRYSGPILLNPGGPGGSGVRFAVSKGREIQTVVDSAIDPNVDPEAETSAKYYDVVGFDPRGIAFTTPGAHCFQAKSIRESWNLRLKAQGWLGTSDAVLGRRWAMVNALGASCAASSLGEADIKQFVSTASVARDMLELAERFGEWRQKERRRIDCEEDGKCNEQQTAVYVPGQEKLTYWGFSYGTLLGSTFASMFPDRVGRLILDGVVDGENYMKALWNNNLEDTEKTMQSFYDGCAEGGPDGCPLAKHGSTPEDIQNEVEEILANLYHNPLQIPGESPEVITYSDVKEQIFMSLYSPATSFPPVAKFLALLHRNNATELATLAPALRQHHIFTCLASGNQTQLAPVDGEASMSIMCSDGDPQDYLNITAFDTFWRELDAKSPSSGSIWACHRMNCAGWKIRPMYRFEKPFGGNTSHPILFIGNTADPVTPLKNAHGMSSLFPGSAVLTQNSPGHCSIAAISPCTVSAIRAYLHNGTLPVPNTTCQSPSHWFKPNHKPMIADSDSDLSSEELLYLATAQKSLSEALAKEQWGLGRALVGEPALDLLKLIL